jgi:Ca2+-binding RTX toxin-like protein
VTALLPRLGLGTALVAAPVILFLSAATATAQTPIPTCGGETATLVGTEGPDVLTGTEGSDVIVALGGDDLVNGGGEGLGVDLICGGEGNDTLNAGGGLAAALSGDGGDDTLAPGTTVLSLAFYFDSPGPVTVDLAAGTGTGWGNDTFLRLTGAVGSQHDDVLSGSARGDYLDGQGGNDQLRALAGSDVVDGDAGDDLLDGGTGRDTLQYGAPGRARIDLGTRVATGWGRDRLVSLEDAVGSRFADVIRGNGAANRLDGGRGDDAISGLAGNDTVLGNVGNDRLAGGAGADRLDGGAGRDQADGGTGRDRCVAERKKRCP